MIFPASSHSSALYLNCSTCCWCLGRGVYGSLFHFWGYNVWDLWLWGRGGTLTVVATRLLGGMQELESLLYPPRVQQSCRTPPAQHVSLTLNLLPIRPWDKCSWLHLVWRFQFIISWIELNVLFPDQHCCQGLNKSVYLGMLQSCFAGDFLLLISIKGFLGFGKSID